jgi:leucine dehydrogenase
VRQIETEAPVERLLQEWDGEEVVIRRDGPTGAWVIIAIHSTRLGPAIGGTRMKPYPTVDAALEDAQRLARGMSHKWAAAGFDAGGGKAVIAIPPDLDAAARRELLLRYGDLVGQLGGLFLTGPDSGTTSEDMDLVAAGAPGLAFCRPAASGGSGDPARFTSLGVLTAIEAVARRALGRGSLDGVRVAIQGVGAVGRLLIGRLLETGASVAAGDVAPFDIAGVEQVPPGGIMSAPCDVFSPCALGGVLDATGVAALDCGAVAGAANNQLRDLEDADRLRERGILYAPDFVANAGGAIAAVGIETRGWEVGAAEERLVAAIAANLEAIFAAAESEEISTAAAARRLAEARLTG